MTTKKYFKLNAQEKERLSQKLEPYDSYEREIFKTVEKMFSDKFGQQEGIEKVKCGLAPMIGPYNCIMVFIPKGKGRVTVPEVFEGFPIWKIYESKTKQYKELIK